MPPRRSARAGRRARRWRPSAEPDPSVADRGRVVALHQRLHLLARDIGVGSHRFHGHELREIGFRSYFREAALEFELLETLVNLETRQITNEATLSLLARHPGLVGIYVAGGGMEGAIAALRDEGRAGALAVVVNEITPESRAGLADQVVTLAVATPLPALCRELVALMVHAIRHGPAEAPGQTFLPFDLWTPESI